jgi:hypothetical protein
MGERRGGCRVWWGNVRERDNLEDASIDERTTMKRILKKQAEMSQTGDRA